MAGRRGLALVVEKFGAYAIVSRAAGPSKAAPRADALAPASRSAVHEREVERMKENPIREAMGVTMRAVQLTCIFGPPLLTAPIFLKVEPLRRMWMQWFVMALKWAGPALIKWGQWAATRQDLFPPDLCQALGALQAGAPRHSFAHTEDVIKRRFSREIFQLFADFEEIPIASGSIAQIHRATLWQPARVVRPDRRWPVLTRLLNQDTQDVFTVAVKVRHPRVEATIERDFALLKMAAWVCNRIPALRWMRLDESVRQFEQPLFEQLDLSHEAHNLEQFNANFTGFGGVLFPRPIAPFFNDEILVETYEVGESVERYISGAANPDSVPEERYRDKQIHKNIADLGCRALLKMMLVDNMIHADMHPGNVHVRIDKERDGMLAWRERETLKIILLDCGMATRLSRRNQANLVDFFSAISNGDGEQVAKSILSFSANQSCEQPDRFIDSLVHTFHKTYSDFVDLSTCIQEMLECVRCYRVNIEAEVSSYIVTTIVLEGWSSALDPNLDMRGVLHNLFRASHKVHVATQTITNYVDTCWNTATEVANEVASQLGSLGSKSYDE